jgi:cysteine desulfurase
MSKATAYMDNFQTTMVPREVVEAMLPYFTDIYASPSSLYTSGLRAGEAVETALATISKTINAKPDEILFTSGGTEANNIAIMGLAKARRREGNHIITSKIDHPSILNTCKALEKEGFKVDYLPVDREGIIDLQRLEELIKEETILVSIIHSSHVIGTIEPIKEVAELLRDQNHRIYLHTDAAVSYGRLPLDVEELEVDLMTLSSHKIHGPKGVGALYIRKGVEIEPIQHGFISLFTLRPGVEDVPGIMGFAKAAEIAHENLERDRGHVSQLIERLEKGIKNRIPDVYFNGPRLERRNPYLLNASFAYVEGEALLLQLDMEGIEVATGSACVSSLLEPNYVLTAIGTPPEIAHGSIRFTLGRYTTGEEVEYVLGTLPTVVERLRRISVVKPKRRVGGERRG